MYRVRVEVMDRVRVKQFDVMEGRVRVERILVIRLYRLGFEVME